MDKRTWMFAYPTADLTAGPILTAAWARQGIEQQSTVEGVITMLSVRMAEAVFASTLQPSDAPTASEIRLAIRASLRRHHGSRGCAAFCAAEYGDHPVAAAARMRWAIALVAAADKSSHAA